MTREDEFAELLSHGLSIKEIAQRMGYKDRRSANATFQRLRRHVGPQAV